MIAADKRYGTVNQHSRLYDRRPIVKGPAYHAATREGLKKIKAEGYTAPSGQWLKIIDTYLAALSEMNALSVVGDFKIGMGNGDNNSKTINWAYPDLHLGINVNNPDYADPLFVEFSGGSRVQTDYDPSVNGTNYSQDDFSVGAYVVRNNSVNSKGIYASVNGSGYFRLRHTPSTMQFQMNGAAKAQSFVSSDNTLYYLDRKAAGSVQLYEGAAERFSFVMASSGVPSTATRWGFQTDLRLGLYFIGGSIAKAGLAEDFNTATSQFITDANAI